MHSIKKESQEDLIIKIHFNKKMSKMVDINRDRKKLLKYMFLNRKTGVFNSKTPVLNCLLLETWRKDG